MVPRQAAAPAQIGIHASPIGFLDVDGYFDSLFGWFERTVEDGFLRAATRDQLHLSTDPVELLARMAVQVPEVEPKWIDP